MKKPTLLLFFLFLFPAASAAQTASFSASPYSFKGWGTASKMGEVSVNIYVPSRDITLSENETGRITFRPLYAGLHYFFVYEPIEGEYKKDGEILSTGKTQPTAAFSYVPINIADVVGAGVIFSANKFPTEYGVRVNFWLEAGWSFDRIRISYLHISNGFGLFHDFNPGFDTIRLTVFL